MELSLSPGFPGDNNELFLFCLDASLPMPPGWHSLSGDDNVFKMGKHCATLSQRDSRRAASSSGGPFAVVLKLKLEAQRLLHPGKGREEAL